MTDAPPIAAGMLAVALGWAITPIDASVVLAVVNIAVFGWHARLFARQASLQVSGFG